MPIDADHVSRSAVKKNARANESLAEKYRRVRMLSERIAAPLSSEDCAIQSMADVSPTKWHLAHTTWFFETFLLKQQSNFQPFDGRYESLFNSYYNSVGQAFPREKRGQISRPGLEEVYNYRRHVDHSILAWLDAGNLSDQQLGVLVLGMNHEQQHQELMLTDIKHVLFCNPDRPAYQAAPKAACASSNQAMRWNIVDEVVTDIGFDAGTPTQHREQSEFAYDNEGPRHRALIQSHKIAARCVTNGEYLEFMRSGGYNEPKHWLSLGWDAVCRNQWHSPLYWIPKEDNFLIFTLAGLMPLSMDDPVCHLSYFEADAYARWAGRRLPTEFEWEHSAKSAVPSERFADKLMNGGHPIHPQCQQGVDFLGNVWEWTASQYTPYPRYAPASGALGEYNGKFMCNQFVLRGGSCATSSDHIRVTYRNFFPPETRWQFSGIRLADN